MFDTNILVAALRSDQGASRKLLAAALDSELVVLASVPLMIEYESVLARPEHLLAADLSLGDMNAVLDQFAAIAVRVELRFLWRPRLKDLTDEMVLETAVNGQASRLVTFNLRHLKREAEIFGIVALSPSEAWRELRSRYAKK